MHSGRISNATRVLGASRDWDKERDGVCVGLAIRDEQLPAGRGMTSAWFPTLEEIEAIRQGAPIYLTILGSAHPPVAVWVGSSPEG